jgi:hypothetical protein
LLLLFLLLIAHAGHDSNTTFVLPLLPPDAGLVHALRIMFFGRMSHVTSACEEFLGIIAKRQPHVVMVQEQGQEEWLCFGRKFVPSPSASASAYDVVLRMYDFYVTKGEVSSSPSLSSSSAAVLIRKELPIFDVQRLRPFPQHLSSSPPPSPSAPPPPPVATIVGVYVHRSLRNSAAKVWFTSTMMSVGGGDAAALQVAKIRTLNPNI